MIPTKESTIEQSKSSFSDRIGFVFQGNAPSSDEAMERLCATLVQHQVASCLPELIVKCENNTYLFVYPETGGLDGPAFFAKAKAAENFGFCRVDCLGAVLKGL